MPESDLALLVRAAKAAGEVALGFWRKSPATWDKDDGSPVSAADIAVNDRLHDLLRPARPAYGWLSEETADTPDRLAAERLFILDPIDGTRAFLDGHGHFAHALAVVEGGRVTAAVVYLPAEGLLYTAETDGPALLNGAVIAPSRTGSLAGASVLTSRATLAPENWKGGAAPPFRRVFRSSLAWRLCLAAEGRFDAMMTLRPAWEWDIAAGCLIAARAGLAVSDRLGRDAVFNRPEARVDGLLAAPPPLWAALREALSDRT